jgi:methylenetetrahydrofolate dehydrogenase (NADP+)/methenyltetrahydrofolate cyclohydrolase
MSAKIIDGVAIAARIREQLAAEALAFTRRTRVRPGLVVILVGDNPASQVYVRSKRKACLDLGWYSDVIHLPADVPQERVEQTIDKLNEDPLVHGILLQLPLPQHLDEQAMLQRIRPEKDVDGFHPLNVGKLVLGLPAPVPCTPLGIQRLLLEEQIPTAGKFAVVVGRSNIVGKPVTSLLMRKGPGGDATVCVCHSRSEKLPEIIRQADILIAAVGRPHFIKAGWIKPGATVIDVGINRVDDPDAPRGYRLVGDVDFENAKTIAGAITPVPGGVGPMTIAMLLHNTLWCAKNLTP